MPNYTWSPPTVQYYSLGGTNYYYVPTAHYTPSSYSTAATTCGCWSCRDYMAQLRAEKALIDHFTEPYITYHPTDDYINATPVKDQPVINPLPEPQTINIYSRYDTNLVLLTISGVENLRGYDFSRKNLEGANFSGMDLTDANFTSARMRNTNFENATLDGANFTRASLTDSYFRHVSAVEAKFVMVSMDYADMAYGDFTDVNFSHSTMYGLMNTRTATFDDANFNGVSGVYRCQGCEYVDFQGGGSVRYLADLDEYRCASCGYDECEHCNEYFSDLYYHESNCSSRHSQFLHEYDYSPYRFRPKGNYPAEPLMGVELEIGGSEYELTGTVNSHDPGEDHLYCKHDGSVDGIEVVTHPMTLAWAKQNFDFKSLLTKLNRVGHSDDNYGIHVHVSRNAFRGVLPDGTVTKRQQPQHQMAWLMFMYRNSDSICKIARRNSDNWASWRKPGKGELKRKASAPDSSTGRYVAINCENDKTYEVRVFRSTLDFTEFMAAIELVDASVNYTRNLTTFDVLHNKAMSWGEFHKWCLSQGAKYSSLLNQMLVQGTL